MSAEPFPNICGPSYETLSPAEGIERSLNYYFEASETPYKPKGPATLYQRPGSKTYGTIPPNVAAAVRGMIQFDGNGVPDGAIFGVSGDKFWQMDPDLTVTVYGTVVDDGKPAYIAANAAAVGQIFVASGGHGYCLNSGTFAEITIGADFFGARDVTFIDGYFVVLSATVNNQQFQISALNDGTTWSGADVGLLLGQADPLQRVLTNIEYLYFLGTRRGQIWYNSGNALFPFTIESGAFLEWGTNAAGSACKAGNQQSTTIYWLGQSAQGANVAMRAQGQQVDRISDHALEAAWSNKNAQKFNGQVYTTTDDCISYSFSWNGHSMVRFIFPTAGTGWDYDITESARVGFPVWNPVSFTLANGSQVAPFERAHAFAFGKHLIGSGGADGSPGQIYEEDAGTYTDCDGTPNNPQTTGTTGFSTVDTNIGDTTIGPAFIIGNVPTAPFYLQFGGGAPAGGELILCTIITGPVAGRYSLTVTRAQGGTTAQFWAVSTVFDVVTLPGFPITRDRIVRLPFNNGLRVILDRLEVFGQPGVGVNAANTTFSAVATNGSDTYAVADTTGLEIGQQVTGSPIAINADTRILAVVVNTSVQVTDVALGPSGTYPITALSQIAGANPVLRLRISRDGGQTWGAELQMPMGAEGDDIARWVRNALGYYRDGAIWLRCTDPVFACLVGGALGIRRLNA